MEQQQGSTYLDLTILSASDLQRGWFSGDQTVAIAWINPSMKKSTGVASGGGCNAQWHEKLTLPLSDADAIARHGKWLTLEIRAQGAFGGDNLLGTVNVPLVEIALDSQKEANSIQTYQLVLPSGKRHGSLSFLGKVVKSRSSSPSATLPSAPPVSLLHGNDGGWQSVACYPPASYSNETSCEKPLPMQSMYLPPKTAGKICATDTGDTGHHDQGLPCMSCGWASHPPQVYPPPYPPQNPPTSCAPCSYVESVAPYPPQQFYSAPYPPPMSMYQHPNPPVAYPPTSVYPPGVPHCSETPYPPPPLYPYPNPYPPPYPPCYASPSYGGGPYSVF